MVDKENTLIPTLLDRLAVDQLLGDGVQRNGDECPEGARYRKMLYNMELWQ